MPNFRPSVDVDYTGRIAGSPAADIASSAYNYRTGNDQNSTTPTTPTMSAISIASTNDNASVNIKVPWTFTATTGQTAGNIDGFIIYMYDSASSGSYTITGSGADETAFVVKPGARQYIVKNLAPNRYYTFAVQAYRKVGLNVNSSGIIYSTISQNTTTLSQPATTANFTGTIAGSPAANVASNATSGLTAFNDTTTFRDPVVPNGTLNAFSPNTGIATQDGNVVVNIDYTYTDGLRVADYYIIFYKQGGGTVSPANPCIVINPASGVPSSARINVVPGSPYTFAFSSARVTKDGVKASSPQNQTARTMIAGNYTGNVNGTGAATVVTNSNNGATAFSGTINYRTDSAPSCSTVFGTISPSYTSDGNVVVNVPYTHSPGGLRTDFILVYYKEGGGTVISSDPSVSTNPATGNLNFTLKPSTTYSFGVQNVRRTESGLVGSSITSSSNIVLSAGNYTGTIAGSPAANVVANAAIGAAGVTNFNTRNDRNGSTPAAPTFSPNGEAVDHTINTDGSANISLEWNYTVGTSPLHPNNIDGFVIYVKADVSPASTASYTFGTSPTDETVYSVDRSKRAFVFPSLSADRFYRFGVQAYRVVDDDIASPGVIYSAIAKPPFGDESPSYRPSATIAFNGDIRGTVAGSPATTVATNATNGATAFTGTAKYRTAGAPTNLVSPTGITSISNSNASKTIRVSWAEYTQGANQADVIGLFYRRDNLVPIYTDSCIVMNVNVNTPAYYELQGVNPADQYSFGIAAGRRTENGIEWGLINTTLGNGPFALYGPDVGSLIAGPSNVSTGGTISPLTEYTPNGEQVYRVSDNSSVDFVTANINSASGLTITSTERWIAEGFVKQESNPTNYHGVFRIFGTATSYGEILFNKSNGSIYAVGGISNSPLEYYSEQHLINGVTWYKLGIAASISPGITTVYGSILPAVYSPAAVQWSPDPIGSLTVGPMTLRRRVTTSAGFDWTGITAGTVNFTGNVGGQTATSVAQTVTVGTGNNLIPNSDYRSAMTATNGYNPNGAVITDGIQYSSVNAPGWNNVYILRSETTQSLYLRQASPVAGGDDAIGIDVYPYSTSSGNPAVIPVVAGQTYCFSAYTQAHRAKTSLGIGYYTVNASPLGFSESSVILGSGGATASFSDFNRQFSIYTAPAGTSYAIVYIRKYNTTAGNSDSYMWYAAPQFERVNPSVTSPGPYVPGPAITTGQLGYSGDLNATWGAPVGTLVGGSPAANVAGNASTAFNGTTEIRNTAIPSNNATIGTIVSSPTVDGNVVVTVPITYSQPVAGVLADGVVVYYAQGATGANAKTNDHKGFSLDPDDNSTVRNVQFTLRPSQQYNFSVRAYRRAEGGRKYTAFSGVSTHTTTAGNYTGTIDGSAASTVVTNASTGAAVATNFNSRNDRNATTPTSPTVTNTIADFSPIVLNSDGTCDIRFNWSYTQGATSAANNVDGFIVYVVSNQYPEAHTFTGTENSVTVPVSTGTTSYGYTFKSLPAAYWHNFAVRGYRVVDRDVASTDVLYSNITESSYSSTTGSITSTARFPVGIKSNISSSSPLWDNLFTTDDYTNAAWTKTRVTVSPSTIRAPDEKTLAYQLIEDTSNNTHVLVGASFTPTVGRYTVYKLFVRPKGDRGINIVYGAAGFTTSKNFRFEFDSSNAVVPAGTFMSVRALQNSWYEIHTMAQATAASSTAINLQIYNTGATSPGATYAGDAVSGLYISNIARYEVVSPTISGSSFDPLDVVGSTWYDTANKSLEVWNGSRWVESSTVGAIAGSNLVTPNGSPVSAFSPGLPGVFIGNNVIKIYDASGVLRVHIGNLSA